MLILPESMSQFLCCRLVRLQKHRDHDMVHFLSFIFVQSSLSLRYVCVCVLNVLLLGQQHSENGLGEWVEFTGGKRSL